MASGDIEAALHDSSAQPGKPPEDDVGRPGQRVVWPVGLSVVLVGAVAVVLTYRMLGYIVAPSNAEFLADNFTEPGTVMSPTLAEIKAQAADALRLLVPLVVVAWMTFIGLAAWLVILRRGRRSQAA